MKEKIFKKGIARRLFSVVLALAMVLTLMPINTLTVFAASGVMHSDGTVCTDPYGIYFVHTTSEWTCGWHTLTVGDVLATGVRIGDRGGVYNTGVVKLDDNTLTNGSTLPYDAKIDAIDSSNGILTLSANHTHAWAYSTNGAVLTATCDKVHDAACTESVSLTLSASDTNYSGSETYSASFSDTSAWTGAGLSVPTIKYYKATAEGGTEGTEEVTNLAGLAAGNYYAAVTAGEATAKAAFKVIPVLTWGDIKEDFKGIYAYKNIETSGWWIVNDACFKNSYQDYEYNVTDSSVVTIDEDGYYMVPTDNYLNVPFKIKDGVPVLYDSDDFFVKINDDDFLNASVLGDFTLNEDGYNATTIYDEDYVIKVEVVGNNLKVTVENDEGPVFDDDSFKYAIKDGNEYYIPSAGGFSLYAKVENNNMKLYYANSELSPILPDHTHHWTYKVDGATLKAYCSEADGASACSYQGTETDLSKAVSLTLSASSANYSGIAVTASYGTREADSWKTAVGNDAPTITYEKKGTDSTWSAITSAPVNAGEYRAVAKVTKDTTDYIAYKEFTISKAEIDTVTYTEPTVVATGTPATATGLAIASTANYTGAISWAPADTSFKYNTAYTATVTLSAKDNYKFADNVTFPTGWTKDASSTETSLVLTKTYDATAKAKITSVTAPSVTTELEAFTTESAQIAALPTSVTVAVEDNSKTSMAITWALKDGATYSTASEAENTFVWTVTATEYANYDTNSKTLTGEVTLKNPVHQHTWNFTADEAVITATCTGSGDCTVENGKTTGVTLTLSASDTNYSGSAVEATMDKTAWEAAGLTAPSIVYEAKTGSALTDNKAVNVGSYTAKITAGDPAVTASVDFDIHGASTTYDSDDTYHWFTCALSGCTNTDDAHKFNKATHSYNETSHKCVCGKVDPTYHQHVLGQKHDAVSGNCVDKGTVEYYDCAGTVGGACGKYLDAEGHELTSIEGTKDATKHKGTATTWTKTETTHKETYDCCGAVKTEEANHTGGTATCQAKAVCSICETEYGTKSGHSFAETFTEDKAATCTEKGSKSKHCTTTGCTETTEVTDIDPLGHTGGTATCQAKAVCTRCTKEYGDLADHAFAKDFTVDKEATVDAEGVKTNTCTVCQKTKTEVIAKLTVKPQQTTAPKTNVNDLDSKFQVITGKNITVKWGKVKEATGYDVYMAYCGEDKIVFVKSSTALKTTIKKLNKKAINQKKHVKCYVVAYKMVEGKKVTLAKTIVAHAVDKKNKSVTDAKSIKLTKTSYILAKNKTAKIKATTVKVNKKLPILTHAAEFRYSSSNDKIATVSKNGKITAKSKGTCAVYVYAVNGFAKKIKVTVK